MQLFVERAGVSGFPGGRRGMREAAGVGVGLSPAARVVAGLLVMVVSVLSWGGAAAAAPVENGKIAFESNLGEIYTINSDGSGQARLAHGSEPAWSSDGTRLAFIGPSGLWVMNADGGGQMSLGAYGSSPAWSPDGSMLAFMSNWHGEEPPACPEGACEYFISVMSADGSGKTMLTMHGEDFDPAWSPDGTRIAFTRGHDEHTNIYVMNADGSGQTPLTTGRAACDREPAWSPDGTKIAFSSCRDGDEAAAQIYVMNADGSDPTRLTTDPFENRWPTWSPDGTKIAFANNSSWPDEIYVMNADGSGRTRLTNGGGYRPDWGPTPCTIVGTEGNDVLHGTPGEDVICGLGGHDQLDGEGGNDVVRGGPGFNFLYGGPGRDLLDGGDNGNRLQGGSGADVFRGGAGGDQVVYWGQRKPVTITIGDGPNDGTAGERDDVQADIENISGGKGDDTLIGNSAMNQIYGHAGNDRLVGGDGRDWLNGGDGDDYIDSRDDVRQDSVTCGNGLDSFLSDADDWISVSCENG